MMAEQTGEWSGPLDVASLLLFGGAAVSLWGYTAFLWSSLSPVVRTACEQSSNPKVYGCLGPWEPLVPYVGLPTLLLGSQGRSATLLRGWNPCWGRVQTLDLRASYLQKCSKSTSDFRRSELFSLGHT
jgi:hypothetical protein